MKKLTIKKFVKILPVLLFSISSFASAQKQPQIQLTSARAPEKVKIDGMLDEWKKIPWAFNSTDRIYYLISNDDDNLYLAVRGLDVRVISKSLRGGLTFTISHSTDKKVRTKATDNVSIIFPISQTNKAVLSVLEPVRSLSNFMSDSVANRRIIDSLRAVSNQRLATILKEIKIIGIKEIADSIISVYNSEGIKAIGRIDYKQPIYEIAIPLKYLGLSIKNPESFSYNIKFDIPLDDANHPREEAPSTSQLMTSVALNAPPGNRLPTIDPDEVYVDTPTNFWGLYLLLKKP